MELFEQANELHLQGKYEEAREIYEELLTQNPDNAGLLATLGTLYLRTNRLGLAICMLEHSAERLKDGDAMCNLGLAYKYTGQYQKCHKWFEKAIRKSPTAETLANYSGLFINVGEPEKARDEATKALKVNKTHALSHWNLALALLELGEWDKAWEEHEWGFKAGMRKERKLGGKPQWDGTHGKTVAVYGEQGLGDEIMFASMLPELQKTNTVIFECHPRLETLFRASFPGIKVYGTRDQETAEWHATEDYDYQISIGSLGQFFRRSIESFPGTPYLKVA